MQLLDTHTFLWFLADDPRLSSDAASAIQDEDRENYVSVASAWEIALKVKLGKLTFPSPFLERFYEGCEANGFEVLPIEVAHVAVTLELPFHHRDPFDRLLAAQSLYEELPLVGADASFDEYGVSRIW